MPQYLTVPIKVSALTYKILQAQYTLRPFFEIRYGANPYASFLHAALDRFPVARQLRRYERLKHEITVGISVWNANHGLGRNLSPAKLMAFDVFVRQIFLERMVSEVRLRVQLAGYQPGAIRQAIEAVYDTYGITEDDLSFEVALRYYTRYRQRLPEVQHKLGRSLS